jgi:hypothetical protein
MSLDVSVTARGGEKLAAPGLRPAPPCAMVIFGASGDLTHRKLIPALFDLYQAGLLGKQFAVLGFSRSALSNDDFRRSAREGIEHFTSEDVPEAAWEEFSSMLSTRRGAIGCSTWPRHPSCSRSSRANWAVRT